MAAVQVGQNPFGDYAPASDQIQGVLKDMYDSFTAELEKDNAHESNQQKAYETLMAAKKQEEKTLIATLDRNKNDLADKTDNLADNRASLANTKEQLAADEQFFSQTKESCKEKAAAWSERTRLRSEELQGMVTALKVLSSDSAKATFKSATTTFLQVGETAVHSRSKSSRTQAFAQLRALAAKFDSTDLVEVAMEIKSGGHFDKVIHMVQNKVADLKTEEQEDLNHRDRCEAKQEENKQAMEDLNFDIGKMDDKLDRMRNTENDLETKIKKTEAAIKKSHETMEAMKDQRREENAAYDQALHDDQEAIGLLEAATASLSKFYSDNNLKRTHFIQAEPAKEPDTWKDEYGGQKSQSTGILAILGMITKDLQREVKEGKANEKASKENFWNDMKDMKDTLDAQEAVKAEADREIAAQRREIVFLEGDKSDANTDLGDEKDVKAAVAEDCTWIKTDLKKRQDKRKLEMKGLHEAMGFLKGIN